MDSSLTEAERAGERVLIARVGEARFAFRLGSVREIIPVPPLTPFPGTPPAIVGITNVRGRVVTVIDGARQWLDGAPAEGGTLLVLSYDGRWMGVRVDDVDRVDVVDTGRALPRGGEVFELPDHEGAPLRVVDVAILLQQVLRDRGEVKP